MILDEIKKMRTEISQGGFAVSFQENGEPSTLHLVTRQRSLKTRLSGFTCVVLLDDTKSTVDSTFLSSK